MDEQTKENTMMCFTHDKRINELDRRQSVSEREIVNIKENVGDLKAVITELRADTHKSALALTKIESQFSTIFRVLPIVFAILTVAIAYNTYIQSSISSAILSSSVK